MELPIGVKTLIHSIGTPGELRRLRTLLFGLVRHFVVPFAQLRFRSCSP
jgi:hypothetical protein